MVFDGARFHFVVVERGQELERESSADPQATLYRVFQTIMFSMVCAPEAQKRRQTEDFRRRLFGVQLGLLGRPTVT